MITLAACMCFGFFAGLGWAHSLASHPLGQWFVRVVLNRLPSVVSKPLGTCYVCTAGVWAMVMAACVGLPVWLWGVAMFGAIGLAVRIGQ